MQDIVFCNRNRYNIINIICTEADTLREKIERKII